MLFNNIAILDENLDYCENMYVGTEGEYIDYIGKEKPEKDYGEIYEGEGRLLMPGYYNAHAHSPMALMRGYGENMALQDWLFTKVFPFEDQLDGNAVYWSTLLCMAESIRYGIVSSSDMYFFVNEMTKAVLDSGAKDNIARSLSNFDGTPFYEMERTKEFLAAVRDLDGLGNGRIKMDTSIHAEYTNDEQTCRALADWNREHHLIMHVHASETKSEHEECKERHNGMTPIQFFNDCGLFDAPSIAAHCIWIEDKDYDILKEKNVTVASCPCSNLKLASGICDASELLKRGINLAIGTDSSTSNNNLDFHEEIKTLAMISKIKANDPTVISPKEVLYAATRGGAVAQGRMDCGLMKKGYKADLIVYRTDVPNMHPVHSMTNNLVYSATGSDVVLTMVDGNVLYKDGEYVTIDVEKTIFEADLATRKILNKLK